MMSGPGSDYPIPNLKYTEIEHWIYYIQTNQKIHSNLVPKLNKSKSMTNITKQKKKTNRISFKTHTINIKDYSLSDKGI